MFYSDSVILQPALERLHQRIAELLGRHFHIAGGFIIFRVVTSGRLNAYLADIDRQAEEIFLRLVKQMAEAEGVKEQLKADNQMEWGGRMNNIRSRAMEIVNSELIYAA